MASKSLRVVVKSLEAFVELVVKKVTLDLVANLKKAPSEGGTPVDTGWARANWVPRIGAPFEGTAGTRQQAETGALDTGTQARGEGEVLTFKLAGKRVHVSNNVPYIVNLNEGTSKQAPAGFVQIAIAKAVTKDLATI